MKQTLADGVVTMANQASLFITSLTAFGKKPLQPNDKPTMNSKLLLLLPFLVASCTTGDHSHGGPREMVQNGDEPVCCLVRSGDAEMRKAVKMARKTVPTFIAALKHPTATQRDFAVKKPFIHDGILEHIWLSNVACHGTHFHGNVDNKPDHIPDVKMGDRVSVNVNEITDWAFVDKDQLVGGYTIRVLYKDLSPERKKAFEAEAKYHITTP